MPSFESTLLRFEVDAKDRKLLPLAEPFEASLSYIRTLEVMAVIICFLDLPWSLSP